MLSFALLAASGAISLMQFLYVTFWSPSAKLQKIQEWIAARLAVLKAEKDRQKATEDRIDKEPPKTGQDLIDDLNKKGGT
jgi:type II secretory pathway component PulM